MKILNACAIIIVISSLINCDGGFQSIGMFKDSNELGYDLISTLKKIVNEVRYIQMDDEYVMVKNEQFWLREFYITNLKIDPSVSYKGVNSDCILNQYCYIYLKNTDLKLSASISLKWYSYFYGQSLKSGTFEATLNSSKSNISVTFVNGTKSPTINFTNQWELNNINFNGKGASQELKASIVSKILNYNGLVVTDLIKNFPEIYTNDFVFSNKLSTILIITLIQFPYQYYIKNEFLYFVTGQGDLSITSRFGFAYNSTLISTSGKELNIQEIVHPAEFHEPNQSLILFMPANIYKDILNFIIEDQQLNYSIIITESQLKLLYNYSVTIDSLARIFPTFLLNFNPEETFIIKCKFPLSATAFQISPYIFINAFCEFETSYSKRNVFNINITIASLIIYGNITTDPNFGIMNTINMGTLVWDSFALDFQSTRIQNSLFKDWAQRIFDTFANYTLNMKFTTFPYEEATQCDHIDNFEDSFEIRNACYLIAYSCK